MKIIISPAKKMRIDTDSLPCDSLPKFLNCTEEIMQLLKSMDKPSLKKLWGCSDAIAEENFRRLSDMDLTKNLTPAIIAYDGIQYQYMAPGVFDIDQFRYAEKNLRILSGFYGILRPFDGVTPYRLEMQAKLKVGNAKNLYAFWGDKIYNDLSDNDKTIINLASKEYSDAVTPYLTDDVRFINCTFGELSSEGKVIEKGTMCKMARGETVRLLAEHGVENPEDIKKLSPLGYIYSCEYSSPDNYTFLKK